MPIYWTRESIPALQGLTPERQKAAVMSVARQVWSHWQVWLPFAILIAGYAVFFFAAPAFPYRLPIVIVAAIVLANVAALPSHNYYQHYLSLKRDES